MFSVAYVDVRWSEFIHSYINAANHSLMGAVKISILNDATLNRNYRLVVLLTKITLMIIVCEKDYLVITEFQLLFARYTRVQFTSV